MQHRAKPLSERKKSLHHFIYLAGASLEDNRLTRMEQLLSKYHSVNSENSRGEAALTEATDIMLADLLDYAVVFYLLKKGANPNYTHVHNSIKQPPLHVAIRSTRFYFNTKIEDVKDACEHKGQTYDISQHL